MALVFVFQDKWAPNSLFALFSWWGRINDLLTLQKKLVAWSVVLSIGVVIVVAWARSRAYAHVVKRALLLHLMKHLLLMELMSMVVVRHALEALLVADDVSLTALVLDRVWHCHCSGTWSCYSTGAHLGRVDVNTAQLTWHLAHVMVSSTSMGMSTNVCWIRVGHIYNLICNSHLVAGWAISLATLNENVSSSSGLRVLSWTSVAVFAHVCQSLWLLLAILVDGRNVAARTHWTDAIFILSNSWLVLASDDLLLILLAKFIIFSANELLFGTRCSSSWSTNRVAFIITRSLAVVALLLNNELISISLFFQMLVETSKLLFGLISSQLRISNSLR